MRSDKTKHLCSPHSYFDDVVEKYEFDRELRLVLFYAIEIIEIALRTKMIYHLSQTYGGLWYLNPNLFDDRHLLEQHLNELQNEFVRSGEIFVKDFKRKHPDTNTLSTTRENSAQPDAWLIMEVATFGNLSKMYKNLKHQLPQKSAIANEFGLNLHNELSSWLESISYLRNIVAHHSRVWSRTMVKTPMTITAHGCRCPLPNFRLNVHFTLSRQCCICAMRSKTTIFSKSSFLTCFQNIRTFRFTNWDLTTSGRNNRSGNNCAPAATPSPPSVPPSHSYCSPIG